MNFCSAVTDDTPRHNTNAANRAEFCWTVTCLVAEDGELMAGSRVVIERTVAVLLARRQARTFSTGLICGAWGGSGRSVMLSGTRSALPADTRFVPEPHLDFLAAHRIGQVGLYLGGKVSKRLPGLRVGFRAGAPKGAETRARQAACLPCVPASSHPSAFRSRVADRRAASRQHRAFPDQGLRGRARQARPPAPRRGVGHAPAPGKPLKTFLVVAIEPIP